MHCVPTDKVNAFIRIRIRGILKVECKFWPASSHH